MGEQVERMAGNARPTAVAMIDEQTGIVRFDEIEIGPATCRSAFERSDAGGEGPIAISPGRWRKKFTGTCYGRTFIAELYFHGNRLHSVFVNDAHSPLTLPLSVSAEGEVKELLRQLANEKNWIQ